MNIADIQKELEIINKKFGYEGFDFNNVAKEIDVISTGCLGLDFKTGIGGIPIGRVTEIYGGPSVGKSSICGHIVANAHKRDMLAAYIDSESDVDLPYFRNLGVDINKLAFYQPDNAEQAFSLLEDLVALNKFGVVILDSVAATSTQAELEGEMTDSQVADKARLMSKMLRKVTPILGKTNTALIFVNQIRSNIKTFGFGPDEVTPGGIALKFKASLRIKLTTIQTEIKTSSESIGSRIRAKIVKNKLAPPFGEYEFTILFGKGIVQEYDLAEMAINSGVLDKKGPWISYQGNNIGQGIFNTVKTLQENTDLKNAIEKEVREILALKG